VCGLIAGHQHGVDGEGVGRAGEHEAMLRGDGGRLSTVRDHRGLRVLPERMAG
jgi:hypothetical protein